jgi:cytochrome c-type biogenesis protein
MTAANRWQTFSHALAFVIGFSLVFVVLGASVAFFGYALNTFLPTFVKIGGAMLILFGLQVLGVFGWIAERVRTAGGDKNPIGRAYISGVETLGRVMYTEGRVQKKVDKRWGYLSSAAMGVFFSAGWIPCVGPVLAAIYLLASDTATVAQGALLLLAYSLGLGIPFLITGAAINKIAPVLRRMNQHLGIVSKITGFFLIFVGFMLFTDQLNRIAIIFTSRFGTGLASVELGTAGLSAAVTIPIAFLAGLLSFLSPCVLPLIPAYIGYLSGTTVADRGVAAPSAPAAQAPAKASPAAGTSAKTNRTGA